MTGGPTGQGSLCASCGHATPQIAPLGTRSLWSVGFKLAPVVRAAYIYIWRAHNGTGFIEAKTRRWSASLPLGVSLGAAVLADQLFKGEGAAHR